MNIKDRSQLINKITQDHGINVNEWKNQEIINWLNDNGLEQEYRYYISESLPEYKYLTHFEAMKRWKTNKA